MDGTITHANSNIRIKHTEEVCLLREVTGVEQSIMKKIVGTDE